MSSTNEASLSVCSMSKHIDAAKNSCRVVRLQPGGLIGEQRIGGGVALVEAVAGELVDQVEQLVGLWRIDVVCRATLDEARALGVHFRLDLLAHGAAQQVGFAERIAGQHLRGLHHLFLIDEDAVGFGEDRLRASGADRRSAPRPFLRSPNSGILSIGPGR